MQSQSRLISSGSVHKHSLLILLLCRVIVSTLGSFLGVQIARSSSFFEDATRIITEEEAADPWPFVVNQCGIQRRQVFAHYYAPFPLSFDNKKSNIDRYAREFLNGDFQDGRWREVGGYIQERPLPVPVGSQQNWRRRNHLVEILRAKRAGIDGFILDLQDLNGESAKEVADVVDLSASVNGSFRIIVEPDMWVLKDDDPVALSKVLIALSDKPSIMFLNDGRMLVAPYNAERRSPSYWERLLSIMAQAKRPIALIPVFVSQKEVPKYLSLAYGISIWGARDITSVDLDGARLHQLALAAGDKTMLPVIFQDVRPRERRYFSVNGIELFDKSWRSAFADADLVQIVTWNDYGESTEVSPSSITGFVQYDLVAFYASWFRCRSQPRIVHDAIYVSARKTEAAPDDIKSVWSISGAISKRPLISVAIFAKSETLLRVQWCGSTSQEFVSGFKIIYLETCSGEVEITMIRDRQTSNLLHFQVEAYSRENFKPIYQGYKAIKID